MAVELLRFFLGISLLLIPGILLALIYRLGASRLEQFLQGSCLGLAMAIYLASLVSHLDLRWFYPLWAAIGVALAVRFYFTGPARPAEHGERDRWVCALLLVVAFLAYALVLPRPLPGGWDPTFHLILARKMQLTQHAIFDWSPFEQAALNYPTGSHVLVVIISALCRLPLETALKNLMPLLQVLSTGQVFFLARRTIGDATAALMGAIAYGLWANYGSIDYLSWGGLPNQLAMLFFIAMLNAWLSQAPPRLTVGWMSILYAAVFLTHHHVMATSGIILAALIIAGIARPAAWRLALAVAIAVTLDAFFLVPYFAKAATLGSTRVFQDGETAVTLWQLWGLMGYVYVLAACAGIVVAARGARLTRPSAAAIPVAVLAALYIASEYAWPLWLQSHGRPPSTAFTPTRFAGDMNYFLAAFVGVAAAALKKKMRVSMPAMIALMAALSLTQAKAWIKITVADREPADFIPACLWIRNHTPPDTIVMNEQAWTTYLTWRRSLITPMPVSEPLSGVHPQALRVPLIIAGKIPPDSPGQEIVEIKDSTMPPTGPVLWQSASGMRVERVWPP